MSVIPVGFGASGDYTLENSLRIRKDASAYLSRDFPTAGDRRTNTYSVWVKRGTISTTQYLFGGGYSFSSAQSGLYFTATNNELIFRYDTGVTSLRTSQFFKDVAAWYHIVAVMDTTQSTASERMRLYINGERVTSLSVANYPAQNTEGQTNTASVHVIGNESYTGYRFPFDGYMAEINFIDGQALTADDFGEFDTVTGVWKPKEYTGTYGTNGFYLPMTPTTQAELQNTVSFNATTATAKEVTGLGFSPDLIWFKSWDNTQNHYLIDTVRGGNSFIYTNANSPAITSQQWIDVFGSDGFTATNNVLSNNYNYAAWCWDAGANQATTGISSVQYMGSGVNKKVTGFGFSPDLVWIKKRGDGTNTTDRDHVIFDTVRGANVQLKPSSTVAEATQTDELMSFDSDGFTVGASDNVNGTNAPYIAWGWDAGSGDPVSNTQGDITSTVKASDATGFSIVTWTGSGVADDRVGHGLNSAPEVIIYKDRNGTGRWYVWTTAIDGSDDFLFLDGTNAANNLSSSYTSPTSTTISNFGYGSSTPMIAYCFKSVSGVADIGTYTGNGSTSGPTVTTGFRPGFVLVKSTTNGAQSWHLYDGTRNPFNTVDLRLNPNSNADEDAVITLGNFTDTGFEITSSATQVNELNGTYLYMAFKGSYSDYIAPFNTDGTIDSRVKANTAKGFSIVNYSGDGSASSTVGHGLSSSAEMILLKDIEGSNNNWRAWHKDLSANNWMYLNLTNAATTAATDGGIRNVDASTFGFINGTTAGVEAVNTSDRAYIAYCFHSVAGYSDFGTYTGTGATGKVITTGFEPAFVMIKRTDAVGNWVIVDNIRNPNIDYIENQLYANLTDANYVDGQKYKFTSTGFEFLAGGSDVNGSGSTYIYMAFADTRDAQFNFDSSGNKNNWTPTNINSNASGFSSYDIMTDVPTLTDADAGNYATANQLMLRGVGVDVSEGSLYVNRNSAGWGNIAATIGVSSGKWYWEFLNDSTAATMVGVDSQLEPTDYVGHTSTGYGYYYNGNKYNNRVSSSYGWTWNTGDIIGVALDMDNGKIWFAKNGTWQASGDPAAGTNEAFSGLTGTYFPQFSLNNSGGDGYINFGQRPFAYTPPTGFKKLNTYNLPDSTIKDGSKYMNTVLYTGDGGSARTVTGVGFQPDFAWFKARSITYSHQLVDAVRGAGNVLFSNLTNDEGAVNTVTSFDSDGVTLDASTYDGTNGSGDTFASWYWKAGGSGSSNTTGTISSTVSANPTSGFSVVTYTGTGSNGTVEHGLGTTPDMVIIKGRSISYGANTGDWIVWHNALSATERLYLNYNLAKATGQTTTWNSTLPSSTVVSLGNNIHVNYDSSSTYVMYSFAAVEGFSAFGSYTGNGSTDGPFIYTGFRPAFVMAKRTDSTSDWFMLDSKRPEFNVIGGGNGGQLAANQTYAESTLSTYAIADLLSNGFKVRHDMTYGYWNASGATYIYAAFAENPFKNSLAR